MSSVVRYVGFRATRRIVGTDEFAHTGNPGQYGHEYPNGLVEDLDGHGAQDKADKKHAN